jgi:chromosome partitioning protein
MPIIAIVSVSGGTGKTTLAANLATVVSKRGLPALVVEWDPANRLGFVLGEKATFQDGWVSTVVRGSAWNEQASRNSDAVDFLPFGHLNSADRTRFEQLLVDDPVWLSDRLRSIELADDALVFLDVERGPSVYMSQALIAADFVLVVMVPSPWFQHEIQTMQDEVVGSGKDLAVHYLLNFADPTRRTSANNAALMLKQLDTTLLHYMIHRDEAVPEALAANLAIVDFSPDAQVSHDLQGLASWLLDATAVVSTKSTP